MKTVLSITVLLFIAAQVRAQESAAWVSCDAKAGTLVIRYTITPDDEDPPWPKKQILYFSSLMDIDEEESTIVGTKSKTVACRLKSDRFEMVFEPMFSTTNLLGRCGAAWTGTVTVKRNGEVVLKEQEFETYDCHQREQMLSQITFRNGEAKPELTYERYDDE